MLVLQIVVLQIVLNYEVRTLVVHTLVELTFIQGVVYFLKTAFLLGIVHKSERVLRQLTVCFTPSGLQSQDVMGRFIPKDISCRSKIFPI